MLRRFAFFALGTAGLVTACGLPTRQDVDMAQSVMEMGQALQDMQVSLQDLQDRVDSLGSQVARQDSLIRSMANLMGAPLPAR